MNDDLKNGLIRGAVALALVALAGIGYMITLSARSDGRPDYCYVSSCIDGKQSCLYEHRPWSVDTRVQTVGSALDAAQAARMIDCPLH